jgi:hypothetical protein
MYQPYNIAVLLTFYSPLIITILILSLSFIFQNLKGLGYMIWLLVFSWLRSWILELSGSLPLVAKSGDICSMVQYSKFGNSTFSMFFIAFSFIYVCAPMFLNRNVNFWTVSAFFFYYVIDAGIRYSSGCIADFSGMALDTLCGIGAGVLAISIMYISNGQKYLYFNEMSSNKDVCTMPSKQTFKCKVYKNGELIGQTNG